MNVDQAAALLVCSLDAAVRFGGARTIGSFEGRGRIDVHPGGCHDFLPDGALAELSPATTEGVLLDTPVPQVAHLSSVEQAASLPEHVSEDRAAAPAAPGEAEDPQRLGARSSAGVGVSAQRHDAIGSADTPAIRLDTGSLLIVVPQSRGP
jgi:hypothetical protein